jgi:hypothetical protein
MLSKMVPRSRAGLKRELWFQAPIPLYLEPDKMKKEVDKVKVKLQRNPGQRTLPIYEKAYTPWMGHTVEGYCRFQATLDEYTRQAPLNNVNKRVGAITLF